MKTVLRLLLHDLRRDWKRPWSMLLFAALPLALSTLILSVFGGKGGSGPAPTIDVAVLDNDKDMLSRVLRSFSGQGDAAQHLRLHFVQTTQEGLRMVENSKASALVVLPAGMTEGLLSGQTNSIELYENPAQQILPKIVRQGVSLLALGLSGAAANAPKRPLPCGTGCECRLLRFCAEAKQLPHLPVSTPGNIRDRPRRRISTLSHQPTRLNRHPMNNPSAIAVGAASRRLRFVPY